MAAAPVRRRTPVRTPARPAPARGVPSRRPARRPAASARSTVLPRGAALLDRLLAGRLWIGLVFVLLVGIVFFNVDLLRMNRDIAVTAEKAETVKRENARLRGDLARLGSSERIQKVAAQSGLVLPAPGEVRYLKANPDADARNALARLKSPGPAEGTDSEPLASAPQTSTTPQATTQPVATPPTPGTTAPQAPPPQPPAPQAATPQAGAPVQPGTATLTPAGQ